jgi:hypothetical protein
VFVEPNNAVRTIGAENRMLLYCNSTDKQRNYELQVAKELCYMYENKYGLIDPFQEGRTCSETTVYTCEPLYIGRGKYISPAGCSVVALI